MGRERGGGREEWGIKAGYDFEAFTLYLREFKSGFQFCNFW